MSPIADIATPDRFRRLGPVWFVMPVLLVAVWLIVPHHPARTHAPAGVTAQR